MLSRICLVTATTVLLLSSAALAAGPFPPDLTGNGWQEAGPMEHFDADTIFNKIDGAADQLIQYGLKQADFLGINNGAGLEITIERYDMTAFENALGIFAAQRGVEKHVLQQGPGWYYAINPGAIAFSGSLYFKLIGNKPDPALQEKAVQLVEMLAKTAAAVQPPVIFSRMIDTLKIPFEGIAFEKNDAFQYHFARNFWFGKTTKEATQRCFFHESESADQAKKLYAQLLESFLSDFDAVNRLDTGTVLKHKYLKTFTRLECSGAWVYGVEGAPDETTLETAAKTLPPIIAQAGK